MNKPILAVTAILVACVTAGVVEQGRGTQIPMSQATSSLSPSVVQKPVSAPLDATVDFHRIKVTTVAAPPPPVEPEVVEEAPPAPPAPVEAPATTPEHAPAPVAEPVPVPVQPAPSGGMDLINQIMAQYGVYAHPATQFHVGPLPAHCMPAHACVVQDGYGKIDLYILPDQITPYLVIHEIAHTQGITDECAADNFTAQYVGHRGSYC